MEQINKLITEKREGKFATFFNLNANSREKLNKILTIKKISKTDFFKQAIDNYYQLYFKTK